MALRFIVILSAFMLFACASDFSAVYEQQAKASMSAATVDEALKVYEASVKKRVTSPDYYEGIGDIYYNYGEFGMAVNSYTQSLRNMGRADVHMKRGRAYMNLHFYEDATVDFNTVIAYHNKDMYTAIVERAKAYIELGQTKEALRDLEKTQKKAGDSLTLFVALGEVYLKLGQLDKSKEYVQKAIMIDGDNADLYLLRGKLFYKTKDPNQALKDFNKALEKEPKNVTARMSLANIYAACPIAIYRDGKKAVELASKVYEETGNKEALIILASGYAEMGDLDKAIELLNKGVEETKDFVLQDDMRVYAKSYREGRLIYSW